MFSSSALRFAGELGEAKAKGLEGKTIRSAVTRGQGIFERYAVHQLEMIVSLMGTGIRRVMSVGPTEVAHLVLDFGEGRRAQLSMIQGLPYQLAVHGGGASYLSNALKGDFFSGLIAAMLSFFKDPHANPVPKAETLEIIAAVDAGKKALAEPDVWISVD
ncbi:MAG: hypothetical protein JNM63_12410 [Spirochaetia bacterium]|nr:hypothetical protein [Spirochaetia bacterium]